VARDIDPNNITADDLVYLNQRPWLKEEIRLQTGKSLEDLMSEDDLESAQDENDLSTPEPDDGTEVEEDSTDEDEPYSEWEYADLVAEVKSRNEDRNETTEIKPISRSKEHLVAALEADDSNE
jgi:hypothetical protein